MMREYYQDVAEAIHRIIGLIFCSLCLKNRKGPEESFLSFLVICSSQDMGNCEIIPFAVPYRNKMKIVKSTISDIVKNVKDKFESCPGFTQQFRLQFEHQDCDMFVDLDEPVLIDHSSNILNVYNC